MRKFIFPVIIVVALLGLFVFCVVLSSHCYVLREKQARQESILLKQSEIIALNTVAIKTLVSAMPNKSKSQTEGGLKMDMLP